MVTRIAGLVLALVLFTATDSSMGQVVVGGYGGGSSIVSSGGYVGIGGYSGYGGFNRVYGAPGSYGVAWGSQSYQVPQVYSSYSSSYGAGYGYGYAPTAILPGPYGAGLWARPGLVAPGYVYGSSYYRTVPIPYRVNVVVPTPPVGAYSPALGPPPMIGP